MTKTTKMKPIETLDKIPEYMSEAETHTFWQKHEISKDLLNQPLDSDLKSKLETSRKSRSHPIALNLNAQLERRLRKIAELEGIGYQTLIKQFVLERTYQEELRLGIVK